VTWLLVVLGLVVGFRNVAGSETQRLLLTAIALTLSAPALNSLPRVGGVMTGFLGNMVTFIAPAMLLVGLKAVLEPARK
jgi:hypothetical protein